MNINIVRHGIGVLVTATALSFGLTAGAFAGVGTPDPLVPGGVNTHLVTHFEQQSLAFPTGFGAGTVVVGAGFISPVVSNTGSFSGSLWSSVFTGDVHNPFGATGMDFVYQLHNSAASADPIARLSVGGWIDLAGPLPTEVGYVRIPIAGPFTGAEVYAAPMFGGNGIIAPPAPGSAGPKPATTVDRNLSGNIIGWNFPPVAAGGAGELAPGLRTPFLIVYTPHVPFATRLVSVIDDGIAAPTAWAPTLIPEPGTYAMMLAGLGLMGFVVRRRRGRGTAAV